MGIWKIEPVLFFAGCLFFVVAMSMLVIKKYFKIQVSKTFTVVYSWADVLWSSFLMGFVIISFVVQIFKIPSSSMENTLKVGDYLFVNKFIYGVGSPFVDNGKRYMPWRCVKAGDIVVFQCPPEALKSNERERGVKKDFVKRCVAVGGDKVEIKDKKLYVNDTYVEEPYVIFEDYNIFHDSLNNDNFRSHYQKAWENYRFVHRDCVRDNFGPVIVPKGHYMMMGDNRDGSFDSRFWGPLPDKYVKGKVLFLYWPLKRCGKVK
jgi:signal peptidase I